MNSEASSSNEEKKVIVAILNDTTERWDYLTFDTREEARQAINKARNEGKAAVFYKDENSDDQSAPPEL
ncbi:hypothetical protein cce_0728 [Crocosphaera subtropica ATCC 51142]|uniref:Uncharacterized protein n=1 Tax=Crocosphaera subtropica (strain ATCC 51142 / BH68) TaxID=43989 RepID=B1WR21_CROS5|nr:hypothetical protein [Crocosphaera subtropica]ACB50079.1 hypothetical protein cce_0728 [Crocosphaera subtropica ATCC 51142]